jgi:glycine/D-amino acid oxidase-like deaminating enzyme
VLVLLVDSLPVSNARAVIVRRSSQPVKDYILLTRRTATARQLSAAVFTLLALHATAGTVPDRNAVVRVQAADGPAAWIETEERRAEVMVRRLRRANAQYVPGFGFVPAVRLTVPARALQDRLRTKV